MKMNNIKMDKLFRIYLKLIMFILNVHVKFTFVIQYSSLNS